MVCTTSSFNKSIYSIVAGGGLSFSPVASIQSVSAATTVISLGCASDATERLCVVPKGLNYTIISDNTYFGAYTMTDFVTLSMGFTCVHNKAASEMTCGEEQSGSRGITTKNAVYDAVPGDFITASVVGGKEKMKATAVPASAAATPTSSGAVQSIVKGIQGYVEEVGDATRPAAGGSLTFAMAVAALFAL